MLSENYYSNFKYFRHHASYFNSIDNSEFNDSICCNSNNNDNGNCNHNHNSTENNDRNVVDHCCCLQ